MAILFKHKWIFLVILCCFNILIAYESWLFIIGQAIVFSWMYYKNYAKAMITGFVIIALLHFFIVFSFIQRDFSYETTFTATLSDELKINGQTVRGFMHNKEKRKIYFIYTFQSEMEKNSWQSQSLAGKQILVNGEWQHSSKEAHEFAFRMDRYIKSKGAVGPFEINTVQFLGEKKTIRSFIASQRFNIARHIEQSLPPVLAQEANALLIGLQDGLDPDVERAYQKLGITHLFAISGLHVALLSLFCYELMIRCKIRVEIATIVLLMILPVYAFLAGGAPSIWRAVLLVEIVGVIKLCKWSISTDDALSIVCIVFLTIAPYSLFQVGFQLSYLATFSLIYSTKLLSSSSNIFIQNFIMTFVCQLLTYPLLIYHFYELSISSFFANVIFVPLFSFIIVPINLLLLLMSYLSLSILNLLLKWYEPLREWLNDFLLYLKDLPYQLWVTGKPEVWMLFLLFASVLIAFYYLDKKKWKHAFVILALPACFIMIKPYLNQELVITFLNVGQGDSIVIELPHRRGVYLIDSGGLLRFQTEKWKERDAPYEVGRQVVVPFLKGKGIRTIDQMILTHADADHVEGAEEVLEEIRVKEVHISPNSWYDQAMADVRREVEKRKIQVVEKMAGYQWHDGDIQFAYLSPFDTVYEGNNDSLVLFIQVGEFKALFTGDLEAEGEMDLISRYPHLIRNLTVLKAGHHGSKTSSADSFVEHTRPSLTIFTAGENNRYNHPANDVVERFELRGLPYLTTGIDGTIEIVVSKEGVVRSVKTYAREP